MIVNSTSVFRKSISKLCKKTKYQYSTCPKDICNELVNKTLPELIGNNDQIFRDDEKGIVLIKMRVPNSGRKEGKSGGFRTYVLLDTKEKETSLLEVYPKTGRYEKVALSESEEEDILEVFLIERAKGILKTHDLALSADLSKEFSSESDEEDDNGVVM